MAYPLRDKDGVGRCLEEDEIYNMGRHAGLVTDRLVQLMPELRRVLAAVRDSYVVPMLEGQPVANIPVCMASNQDNSDIVSFEAAVEPVQQRSASLQ
ncbi:hypothetical protein LTR17_006108 [Elasticomyces elasticus]|nr:hypothetical protein LTR17_006108 [Elasticomyces elasticus]